MNQKETNVIRKTKERIKWNKHLREFKASKNKKINLGTVARRMIIIFLVIIFNILGMSNAVQATSINAANIYTIGDCGKLLTYKGTPVKVSYVEYNYNGVHYPAYCMDKTKSGAETTPYTVSVQEAVKDVGLWRRIVNGYPYKTIQELGVNSKEEAFTATKQAVYCYIHNNNPSDYGAIGEAGRRTLNAMNKIINDANNSSETKISSTITINRVSDKWEQDSIEKNYVSKIYSVKAGASIEKYKVTISKENGRNLGGIKLTDENNKERSEFNPNEKFKVLIPIKNMTNKGGFNLKVESKVKTKPVLYGIAPDSNYQDYALTAATFEDGIGTLNDTYYKNETKIIIIKKDQETAKLLPNVEFELLDKNKKTIYSDLKTNKDGKITIENLIPGSYYLKETKTLDGYELYDQPIRLEVDLNQEVTVTVNNLKQEKPKIETKTKLSKEIITKRQKQSLKKLPVTGI